MESTKYPLTNELIKSIRFSNFVVLKSNILSVDWTADGELFVLCTSDGCIQFYYSSTSTLAKSINGGSKHVDAVKFIYSERHQQLLVALGDVCGDATYEVRLWSLESNAYIRCFSSPSRVSKDVDGLLVHPTEGYFLILCEDHHLRYYSILEETPLLVLKSANNWIAASFDTEGFVFAASLGNKKIHLFNCENLTELKCFDCSDYMNESEQIFSVVFSPTSDHFVITTNCWKMIGFQALYGQKFCEYHRRSISSPLDSPPPHTVSLPAFTPDGNFIASAAWSGSIDVWTIDGQHITHMNLPKSGVVTRLFFNPGRILMLSVYDDTILYWLPSRDDSTIQE